MSRKMKLEKAQADYRKFINDHSASRNDPDLPAEQSIPVPPDEVLNEFLASRSEHEEFRGQLSNFPCKKGKFSFNKERWDKTRGSR